MVLLDKTPYKDHTVVDDFNDDWYTYLTEEFKVDRNLYKTTDRVVVDCLKCMQTRVIRLDHLKEKIRKLGCFECSICRKNVKSARLAFKVKYGDKNPWQLEEVKKKIKASLVLRKDADKK